jgi:hypothetical protein
VNAQFGQCVHEFEFGGRATDDGGEEVEEGRPCIRRCSVFAGVGGDPGKALRDKCLQQRLLAREMPEDGADADAGRAGNLLGRCGRTSIREDPLCRSQHPCAVALRVGAQGSGGGHRPLLGRWVRPPLIIVSCVD